MKLTGALLERCSRFHASPRRRIKERSTSSASLRGTHKALSVCRWRARRTDAERKLFFHQRDPGVHRLSQDLNFQSNRSVNSEEEVTDVDVPAGGIICIEVTFADARGLLKHARFTPTHRALQETAYRKVHPLDARWIFDRRVRLEPPEFQPN